MSLKYLVYFVLLLAASILGALNWKKISGSDRFIPILMWVTLSAEAIAHWAMRVRGNSLFVYHYYSPLEFFLTSLYFNYSIAYFKRNGIGLIIGLIGVIVSIYCTMFIQDLSTINSYFQLFEGTFIIVYCLISFHQILLNEEYLPYRFAHFWITTCFLIFWSTTFTGWGIYHALDKNEQVLNPMFEKLLGAVNYLFYSGIAIIFLNYKKLTPSGA